MTREVLSETKKKRCDWKAGIVSVCILSLDIIIHVHQVLDALHIIRDVGVAVNGVLDYAGGDGKVDHVHRTVMMHHGID